MKTVQLLLLSTLSFCLHAQEVTRARHLVDTLASPAFHGRGYVQGGDSLAAAFLAQQFDKIGLAELPSGRFQAFRFPVNTFPSRMSVAINGKSLIAGKDFILHADSKGLSGKFHVGWLDSSTIAESASKPIAFRKKNTVPAYKAQSKLPTHFHDQMDAYPLLVKVVPKKLTFTVAQHESDKCVVEVLSSSFPKKPKKIQVDIENLFLPAHTARNVLGWLEGTSKKDSFLIISAHYDHLGQLGKEAYFPGANDNASGVAMLLELARYYAQPHNRLPYSILFIAFAGEEAGLVGSQHFVKHPLIPLPTVRFVMNLDLLGSGKEGITIVNGTLFKKEFAAIDSLNKTHQWFPKVTARGKAANSDHYPFSEKGVPAFFLYTLGEITAYHDVDDKASGVTFSKFKEVFEVITGLFRSMENR